MLLFHAIRKTYSDFEEVYQYRMDEPNGTLIEADKELKPGMVMILSGISSDYAIIIVEVWEEKGQRCFSHISAKELIVRARIPID